MHSLTQFKKIPILPLLIALVRASRRRPAKINSERPAKGSAAIKERLTSMVRERNMSQGDHTKRLCLMRSLVLALVMLVAPQLSFAQQAPTGEHYGGRASDTGTGALPANATGG